MKYVATLIVKPQKRPLDEAEVAVASRAIAASGAEILGSEWLAEGEAADLFFTGPGVDGARRALGEAFAGAALDIICQPAEGKSRRKAMLVADMDSTILANECIDELADLVGLKREVSAITEAAMRGELDFEAALTERLALLAGLEEARLEELYQGRLGLTPGAGELVATMNAAGALTCLVSGGFTWFTDRVGAALQFGETRANRLALEEGRLTGALEEPVLGAAAKRAALVELRRRRGLAPGQVLAVGDGANDIPMLREAGLGVAFHAKPKTRAAAAAAVDHCDLAALLFAQGYRRDEFVAGPRALT